MEQRMSAPRQTRWTGMLALAMLAGLGCVHASTKPAIPLAEQAKWDAAQKARNLQPKPFTVEGRITGEDGKPMAGVKIDVHGGMGTLMPVGEALSGEDGRYTVSFGPGRWAPESPEAWPVSIPLQAATIYAHKDGFYEKNLCRGGDLGMAGKLPEKDENGWFKTEQIVLPGKPSRLDFVMLPAARVSGRMVDPKGKPVAGKRFDMHGPTGPSASVMSGNTTDADGRFKLASLPCRVYAFGFPEKEGDRWLDDVNSRELNFARAGAYEVELVYDAKAHTLACRPVARPEGLTEQELLNPPPKQPAGEAPLPAGTMMLSHTGDSSPDKRSLGASGHAEAFERQDGKRFIEAVEIYASRYGSKHAPEENFHLYVLNEKFQPLADVEFPYSMIERDGMKWYRLRTPSIEVPEKFYVALDFNPHQTKGIYLGLDKGVKESHSLTGLPEEGYEPLKEQADWMIRVQLSGTASGAKGTKRLADWRPPQPKADPFKGCLEVKLAEGTPDGMQSYGGAGAALKLKLAEMLPRGTDSQKVKLKGFRVYAGRYGSGYDLNASLVTAMILGKDARPLWNYGWPYARFTYKTAWVELPLDQPVAIGNYLQDDGTLVVGFDPQAHQTKGIYWQYRKVGEGTGHSLGVVPAKKFFETPGREWMIKIYFETEPPMNTDKH